MDKMKAEKLSKRNKPYGFVFLGFVVLAYGVLFIFSRENIFVSLKVSGNILIHLLPILAGVILFMGIANYLVKPRSITKYVGKSSGFKGWFFAASAGVLSHGPIYIWFPLLKEFRQQGMRSGLAAVFLYNRAIKIPLLPLLVYYFGIRFAVVLLVWMLLASMAIGKIVDILD
jgi:uncharacterized membrane protein YraQ (UPF0718 family)